MLDAGYASSSLLAGGGASERGCLPIGGRTGRGRLAMARFRPDAFSGGNPWQYSRAMRSRAAIRGNSFTPCIPKRASDGKRGPSWQHIAAVYPKRAGFGKICSPCIQNALQIAFRECIARRSCQGGALFAALAPRIMHGTRILPGSPHCTDPSNHAYRADLAIRRRRTARAIASTAPPLWRGSLPRDGRTGRGWLLVGRGGALPKECVALWGHRVLTEKPTSAKRRLRIPGTSNFVESREPTFAGGQGWAAARRCRSNGPAERGLLAACGKVVSAPHKLCRQLLRRAVRALGTSFCRAHILPRHMACCPRARSPSIPLDEKVSPLVLFMLTIPPGGI